MDSLNVDFLDDSLFLPTEQGDFSDILSTNDQLLDEALTAWRSAPQTATVPAEAHAPTGMFDPSTGATWDPMPNFQETSIDPSLLTLPDPSLDADMNLPDFDDDYYSTAPVMPIYDYNGAPLEWQGSFTGAPIANSPVPMTTKLIVHHVTKPNSRTTHPAPKPNKKTYAQHPIDDHTGCFCSWCTGVSSAVITPEMLAAIDARNAALKKQPVRSKSNTRRVASGRVTKRKARRSPSPEPEMSDESDSELSELESEGEESGDEDFRPTQRRRAAVSKSKVGPSTPPKQVMKGRKNAPPAPKKRRLTCSSGLGKSVVPKGLDIDMNGW